MSIRSIRSHQLKVGDVVQFVHYNDMPKCIEYNMTEGGYRKVCLAKDPTVLRPNEICVNRRHTIYFPEGPDFQRDPEIYHDTFLTPWDKQPHEYFGKPMLVTKILDTISHGNRYEVSLFNHCHDERVELNPFRGPALHAVPDYDYYETTDIFPFTVTDGMLEPMGYHVEPWAIRYTPQIPDCHVNYELLNRFDLR